MSSEAPQIKSKMALPGRPPRLKRTPRQKKRIAQKQRISGAIVDANNSGSTPLSYRARIFRGLDKVVKFMAVIVFMKTVADLNFFVTM